MNERIHVGIGTYIGGGVTVFPVWPETPEVKNFSWKPGTLTVGEVEQGARVDTLQITNTGSRPHVVIEGDIFEGGWQTRTAASTMVIGSGETVEVPVLCVEQGRWGGDRRHANSRTRRTPYGVRKRMYDSRAKRRGTGQGEVWDEIHKMQTTRGFNSTGSLSDSLDNFKSSFEQDAQIRDFANLIDHDAAEARVLPGQRGVMIGINGHISACEIFGSTSGLKERFDAIIESARFEAGFGSTKKTPNYRARDFATTVTNTMNFDEFIPEPVEVSTPMGPLALTSFSLGAGLVYAAILNQQEIYA
jgi:hypothetical protein